MVSKLSDSVVEAAYKELVEETNEKIKKLEYELKRLDIRIAKIRILSAADLIDNNTAEIQEEELAEDQKKKEELKKNEVNKLDKLKKEEESIPKT